MSVVSYLVETNSELPLGSPQGCHVMEGACPEGQDPCYSGTRVMWFPDAPADWLQLMLPCQVQAQGL